MKTSGKILVVGEETPPCSTLLNQLTDTAYTLSYVKNQEEAIQKLMETRYDVLIVAPETPAPLAILQSVRDAHIPIEVILLRQEENSEMASAAIRLNAANYLTPPFHPQHLYRSVVQAIQKRHQTEQLDALKKKKDKQESLHHAWQRLTTTTDLDQVLLIALQELNQLVRGVASSIWLMDKESGELVCWQVTGEASSAIHGWRLAPGEGLAGWVVEHAQSLVIPDTRLEPRYYEEIAEYTELDLRSILAVPLRTPEGIIGTLELVDLQVNRFDTADQRIAEQIADAAAIAIANARCCEELHQRLSSYKQAEEILSTSESLFHTVVDKLDYPILILNERCKPVYMNESCQQLFGYSPDVIKFMDNYYMIAEEERQDVRARFLRRLRDENAPDQHVFNIVTQEGAQKRVKAHLVTIHRMNGQTRVIIRLETLAK